MEGSSVPTCWKTVSPEEASAPKAAMKPSMANLPLTVSGALPAKAMASPKVGAFGAGGGGGGGVAALPSGAGTFGSSAARTATNLARLTRLALRPRGGESEGGRGDGLGGEHTCLVEALVFEFVRRWATVGDLMHTFFNPDKEGWLWKQGGRYKSWKR